MSHLHLMDCVHVTRHPPWSFQLLQAQPPSLENVLVSQDHSLTSIVCTPSQLGTNERVSDLRGRWRGGGQWSGSGWRQREGITSVMCQDGGGES